MEVLLLLRYCYYTCRVIRWSSFTSFCVVGASVGQLLHHFAPYTSLCVVGAPVGKHGVGARWGGAESLRVVEEDAVQMHA